MTAVHVGTFTPGSPEWHAARTHGVGGSEASSVVGLSPWVSAFSLWQRKAGAIGPQQVTPAMEWGHRLESAVLKAFAERAEGDFIQGVGTYAHRDRPWQLANPDALLDSEPVDAKTADAHTAHEWGPDGSDVVPPHYRCQLIQYGDVLGTHAGWIACLIGGNDFRVYHLKWEESEAAWLREKVGTFWQTVLDGKAPPLDGSDSTYQAVREMHPEIDGSDIDLSPRLFARYEATRSALDGAKERHQQAKTEVLQEMGEARRAYVDGIPVLRRQPHGRGGVALYPIPQTAPDEGTAA